MRRATTRRGSDLLLALGVLALELVETFAYPLTPYAASIPLGVVQAGAVAYRRRAPLAAVVVASAALFAETAAGVSLHTPVSPIIVGFITIYSAAQYEPRPRAVLALLVAVCGIFGSIELAEAGGEVYGLADRSFVAVFTAVPWIIGRALHGRRREADDATQRAERLEREHELAVEEERIRIARELHDVIAHSLSVIVVQAGAGERIAATRPAGAEEVLRSIQDVGRQALAEMSRLVGVLRQGGEEAGLAPQRGLGELDPLLEETRTAGLPVELHVDGLQRPLPIGLDLSAYRIVQEALTNARKHAGPARVDVTLSYSHAAIVIEVLDDGGGVNDGPGSGHGLIGMRERAAVFGGELEAGPRPGGGFAVRATLPLEAGTP